MTELISRTCHLGMQQTFVLIDLWKFPIWWRAHKDVVSVSTGSEASLGDQLSNFIRQSPVIDQPSYCLVAYFRIKPILVCDLSTSAFV